MNRLFGKNRKVKKVVALWLVISMLLMPFVDTAGYRNGAKAEENEVDSEGPEISDISFTYMNMDGEFCDLPVQSVDDNGVYHAVYGTYRLSFKATEAIGGSGLVEASPFGIKVFANDVEVDADKYSISYAEEMFSVDFKAEDILSCDAANNIKFTISDNSGNESEVIVDELEKVQLVKSTCAWASVLKDSDGENIDITSGAILSKVSVGKEYSMEISYESAGKVSEVSVSCNRNGNDELLSASPEVNEPEIGVDGLYRNTYYIKLPSEDITLAEIINSIKVSYKYEDVTDGYNPVSADYSVLDASNDICYDPVAPVVVADNDITLQESADDGATWTDISSTDAIFFCNAEYKYRYVFMASDDESGIDKAYVHKVSDGIDYSQDIEASVNVDGTCEIDLEALVSENGTANYVAYAVDKAGNKSDRLALQKIKIKSYSLVLDEIKLFDANDEEITYNSEILYTNQVHKLVVKASSGYELTKVTLTRKNDNETYSDIEKIGELLGTQSMNEDGRYEISCEFTIPSSVDNLVEWFKEIIITVEDDTNLPVSSSGTNITSVVYDSSAPVVSKPEIADAVGELEESDDNVDWHAVSVDEVQANGVYYSDPAKFYRYKVFVSEIGSGIETVYAKVGTEEYELSLVEGSSDTYVLAINPEVGKTINYSVIAEDKAGNLSEAVSLTKVRMTDMSLSVKAELKLDEDNASSIEYDSHILYTNQNHIINVVGESGYPITKITLNRKNSDGNAENIYVTFAESENEKTNKNRYRVEYSFDIPNAELINEFFGDLSVSIEDTQTELGTDEDHVTVTSEPIRSVMYDGTIPKCELLSGEISSDWVKSYLFRAKFMSGNQSVEAPFESISYKLTGTDYFDEQNVSVCGTEKIVEKQLPTANNLDGVKITYTIKDLAGNKKTVTKTVKVDSDKPFTTLKVNGENSFEKPINVVNGIDVSYKDNLTIDKVLIKVTGPDGIVKQKIVKASIEQVDLSGTKTYKLTDFYGDKVIKNGDYEIVLEAKDKAGNSATKRTVKFTYDGSRPTISKPSSGTLQCSKDGGKTWEFVKVSQNNTAKGVYYTNPEYSYRYIVKASDVGTGIARVYATINSTDKKFTKTIIKNEIYYTLKINPNTDSVMTYNVTAEDKAGNKSINPVATQKVLLTDREFVIKVNLLDKEGNIVSPDVLPKYLKESGYRLKVTTSSGYPIKLISLIKKDAIGDNDNIVYKDFKKPYNVRSVKNRYTVVQEISIPTNVNVNEWFASAYVFARDEEGNTVRVPQKGALLSLLYDVTKPEIETEVPEKWVKNYTLNYNITSGKSGDNESPLEKITYSISDSVEDTNGEISLDGNQTMVSGKLTIPEAAVTDGTRVVIRARDVAGNEKKFTYVIKVDSTKPTVSATVNDKTEFDRPLRTLPQIKVAYGDNLSVAAATVTVKGPDGAKTKELTTKEIYSVNITNEAKLELTDIYGKDISDGSYSLEVIIKDKVGNSAKISTIRFIIDRTKPVISSKITAGTQSEKNKEFYSTSVEVTFTLKDMSAVEVSVLDNDNPVSVTWKDEKENNGVIRFTTEGKHSITYSVEDKAGNKSKATPIEFVIDKTKPVITARLNGNEYTEDMGAIDLTTKANISISVSDVNNDVNDINYKVTTLRPDMNAESTDFKKSSETSFSFEDQADYSVEIYAIDKANNKSVVRNISFRVDSAAPEITISVPDGNAFNEEQTISINVEEAFWKDGEATLKVYRSSGDGVARALLDTEEIKLSGRNTTITKTYNESGEYSFEVTAKDRALHESNKKGQITLDMSKPDINILADDSSLFEDYGKTKEVAAFTVQITDNFYASNRIDVKCNRVDISGKNTALELPISGEGNSLVEIPVAFDEDGIYEFSVTATDDAGNVSEYKLEHFTVDRTKPDITAIEEAIKGYDGKKINSFALASDIDNLIEDLTVCDCKIVLNGVEFNGNTALEDGVYVLSVVAVDELGNESKVENVTFEMDSTKPNIMIDGVENKETKNETYNINIGLQLDEDSLISVKLNGKEQKIDNNSANITVDEKGDYTLEIFAKDAAGNEAVEKINFTYGKKAKEFPFTIVGIIAVVLLGTILIVVKKKSNKDNN